MGSRGKLITSRQCANCGIDVPIYHKKRLTYANIFCSKACEAEFRKSKNLNCECEVCHKKFHRKQSHIDKYEHQYCSIECHKIAKKQYMAGENNHQFGLKGNLNSSWKSDEKISTYGYKLIRCLEHPFRNSDDMVFEHRLVAEKYLLTDNNKVTIDDIDYLSNEYHVHHLDFDRLNNSPDNLYVINKKLHMQFHMLLRKEAKEMNNNIKCKTEDIFTKEELKNKFYNFINGSTNTN